MLQRRISTAATTTVRNITTAADTAAVQRPFQRIPRASQSDDRVDGGRYGGERFPTTARKLTPAADTAAIQRSIQRISSLSDDRTNGALAADTAAAQHSFHRTQRASLSDDIDDGGEQKLATAEDTAAIQRIPRSLYAIGGGGDDGDVRETLFQKLMSLEEAKNSAVVVIKKWKDDGNSTRKYQLNRIVRQLRRHKRFKHCLEICEWMTTQEDIRLLPGDYAVHLDLIAKLRGLNSAEQFFEDMPKKMRSGPTLSSLLHTYVQHRAYDKAEALMEKMTECGYLKCPLPYNHMMTMYLENGKLEKIPELLKELKKNTTPDVVTFNLWLTMCQSQNDVETAEKVLLKMKKAELQPDWITYNIIISLYTKTEKYDKAECTLMEMEKSLSRKNRSPYPSLISLHTNLGNRDEVERIWKQMKSWYYKLNDAEYKCMIESLLKLGDQENAQKLYAEWESISQTCDVRMANVLIRDYVNKNQVEKAITFLHRIEKKGVKRNCTTWEFLTRGFLKSKQTDGVMECFRKAIFSVKRWEPNLVLVREIYQHLEEQRDIQAAENLLTLLRQVGFVTTEIYNCHLRTYAKAEKTPPVIEERMAKDNVLPDSETTELIRVTNEFCITDVLCYSDSSVGV